MDVKLTVMVKERYVFTLKLKHRRRTAASALRKATQTKLMDAGGG
jgi:hypothetical protein